MTIRTRVAPSPTGLPHLGTAYVALFNRAFAHQHRGKFVLRMEDTDVERSDAKSDQAIQDALRWLGLDWDEGPDVGGPHGPYRCSERLSIYHDLIAELVSIGGAFHCFCTKERLDEVRSNQRQQGLVPKYDGHCIGLSMQEIESQIEEGVPHVIRLKVPTDGSCVFHDTLRGPIEIPWGQVDMQILLKSDRFPTYHFAASVDDHLMEISHIFRGEEWLSSCPKHQLIYTYFGWEQPELIHLPLLRNPDHSKISKRKQSTSINYFRRCGYLPEALLNYLATMGFSMPDEREMFSFQEFQEALTPARVSTSGPVFDLAKLSWLNGQYIRSLSHSELKEKMGAWAFGDGRADAILRLVHDRTERFDDVFSQADYLLGERATLTAESFNHKKVTSEDCVRVLYFSQLLLEQIKNWDSDVISETFKQLAALLELKFREFLFPLFVAISGRSVSLPLFDSIQILGLDVVNARLRSAINVLGGVSKKVTKRLDAEWHQHASQLIVR
ncbi:MAG: glutamate--tRNA ligase [Gammaproteobacteria bacterium]|nr:glutamate--tRNA ligase [Gammaproteobacteria bacterium]MYF01433.1 glutamate--tRNA ligase [Gammaproteobacteria bacterium]